MLDEKLLRSKGTATTVKPENPPFDHHHPNNNPTITMSTATTTATKSPTVVSFSPPSITSKSENSYNRRRLWVNSHLDDLIRKNSKRSLSSHFERHFESTLGKLLLYLIAYGIIAIVAYTIVFESWSIIDALYYAVTTLFTVGYGDLYPTTDAGRLFTIFFSVPGIVAIGLGLGMLGSSVADYKEHHQNLHQDAAGNRVMTMFDHDDSNISDNDGAGVTKGTNETSFFPNLGSGFISYIPLLTLLIIIALSIGYHEQWTIIESLYFLVVTATTCGYGDMTPDTQTMRLIGIFFIPLAVAIVGYLIGDIAKWYTDEQVAKAEKEFMEKELTLADLEAMDDDHDAQVSKLEFIKFMLVAMQKVDSDIIESLDKLFDRLDVDRSGTLTKEDLRIMMEKKKNMNPKAGAVV